MFQTPTPDVRSPRHAGVKSPNVRNRVMEKEELSGLNDRLATYIDRMRQLEQQNSKLIIEAATSQETFSREVDNIKNLYQSELAEARKLLDDTSKEKALLQLENKKLSALTGELHKKLDKELLLKNRSEDELKRVERRLHEKESLISVISKERKQLDDKVKDLEEEVKRLEDELDKQKKSLELEIIRRVEAENRAQTFEEEIAFIKEVHREELSKVRSVAESYRVTVDSVDGPKDYDSLLRDKLEDLREEFEDEAQNAKDELEQAYRNKFDDLKDEKHKDRALRDIVDKSFRNCTIELDKLKSDYNLLDARYKQIQITVSELDRARASDLDDFKKQLNEKTNRIDELNNKLENLQKDYEDLLGVKIGLDIEISAYRKMLEGEEERLQIPTPQSERRASRRGTKRGRDEAPTPPEITNVAAGGIEVEECDVDGKYVKLKNSSENDEPLGGWFIQRVVDSKDEEAVEYKFTPKFVLKGGQSVTIWSQSSGVKQKAPTDLVWKTGDWNVGTEIVTNLINSEAEILAKHSMKVSAAEDVPRRTRKRRTGGDRESCTVM